MKKFLILLSLFSINAHAFSNLDFESPLVPVESDGTIQVLDWSIAVPGWSHSAGDDTGGVHYGAPHLGVSQWFLLAGEGSWPPLAGNYSLSFKSGNSDATGEGEWVNAYIAQTGIIPANANSIQLLATGPIAVTIGGNQIALFDLGNNLYRGDISAYAGLDQELRIINTAMTESVVTVDNIEFSAVPLPTTAWLFGSSFIGLVAAARRRKFS